MQAFHSVSIENTLFHSPVWSSLATNDFKKHLRCRMAVWNTCRVTKPTFQYRALNCVPRCMNSVVQYNSHALLPSMALQRLRLTHPAWLANAVEGKWLHYLLNNSKYSRESSERASARLLRFFSTEYNTFFSNIRFMLSFSGLWAVWAVSELMMGSNMAVFDIYPVQLHQDALQPRHLSLEISWEDDFGLWWNQTAIFKFR